MENPLQAFFARHDGIKHHDLSREADIPLDTLRAYVSDKRFPVKASVQRSIERGTEKLAPGDAVTLAAWEAYELHLQQIAKAPPIAADPDPAAA